MKIVGKGLRQWKVRHGLRVFVEIALANIRNDADNLSPGHGRIREGETTAEGILFWEEFVRECLIHDYNRGRVDRVVVVERAACEHGEFHSGKELRIDRKTASFAGSFVRAGCVIFDD